MDLKALVLIPARFASTRFPGKPLAKINSKPMIQWVYEGCTQLTKDFKNTEVAVVTDNDDIESCVKAFGGVVVRVDDDLPSGSERIYRAYERYFSDKGFDFVVNVQGDEPLIESELLKTLLSFHENKSFDVATVIKRMPQSDVGYLDPNKVKAIYSEKNGQCHYFTRSSFPYNRNNVTGLDWFLHVGIYSFKPHVLKEFCSLEMSKNEDIECLEQLRLLDNGYTIGAVETNVTLSGVDTPEDIAFIEGVFNGR